jgi:hypothetical protein
MTAWASARLRTATAAQHVACVATPAQHGVGWLWWQCLTPPRQLSPSAPFSHAAARHSTAVHCQRTERRRDKRIQREKRRLAEDAELDPQANYACFDDVGNSAAIHVFGLNHLEVRIWWSFLRMCWVLVPLVCATTR